jgi:phosphatidylserine synthase 1
MHSSGYMRPRAASGTYTSGSEFEGETSASRAERIYRQWFSSTLANGDNCPVMEVSIPWLYESHSLVVLSIVSLIIWYSANHAGPFDSLESALLSSIPYLVSIYLAVGLFAFPSGPFIRPHPIVWKITFGFSVLYLLALICLLVPSPTQSRQLLHWIDPRVGAPFDLPLYAEDCTLSLSNFYDKMDIFVLCHFLGWLVKALYFRNRVILWTFSIVWEFIEIFLVYMVPNFGECWWDQWIMDVLICNGLGIECGMWICNYLQFRDYNWTGVYDKATIWSKLKRVALQFTPESWSTFDWESDKTIKRFLQVQIILILSILCDLNAFMLKLFLYIPTTHPFSVVRLLGMAIIGAPAYRQAYLYFVDARVSRLGTQAIVTVMITVAEFALVIKSGSDWAVPPMPRQTKIGIISFLLVYAAACVLLLRRMRKRKTH